VTLLDRIGERIKSL